MLYKDQKKAAFNKSAVSASTIDEAEISRFNQLAEEWWKPKGAFKVVHAFNAVRVAELSTVLPAIMGRETHLAQSLAGLTLLDVGCGAGIVTEPMSRLGAKVTAIDASERNILVAKQHAEKLDVDIAYCNLLPEDVVRTGRTFDIVMSLEVIEHVADATVFLEMLTKLVKPGGVLVIGTINRTAISFIKAIVGAEYILRWLPKGTHSWRKFVRPLELDNITFPAGFVLKSSCGVDFNPFSQAWKISKNQKSTYMRFYKREEN
jgi:2-polyprenyl-6-hydroxyphenyl methylase / 3-demethylubiquinone-9 3-methyltransferase